MRLFSDYQVRASFFFPFGRDLSGREPMQSWRARRQLGLAATCYGTLLPAADLAAESARLLRVAHSNGHDVGVFGGSPVTWRRRMATADAAWVKSEIDRARHAAADMLEDGCALGFATPAWQSNPALMDELSTGGFLYSSMTRGRMPYRPMQLGQQSTVIEIPTTLPTIDEALRQNLTGMHDVHEYIYAESQHVRPAGHVFALSAEREGGDRFEVLEKLLIMWKGQEGSVRALADVIRELDRDTVPRHRIGWQIPPGGLIHQATQSIEVPR
ncbi:MAG: hypothetical protein KDI82_11105 [Gammaproteobacteria bacterium]|nr:hypothetical protein [Gammaproteobacteria bacterium]